MENMIFLKQIRLFPRAETICILLTKNIFFTCEEKYTITLYIHHSATAITELSENVYAHVINSK